MLVSRRIFGAMAAGLCFTAAVPLHAEERGSFYSGKTVNLIIPNGAMGETG